MHINRESITKAYPNIYKKEKICTLYLLLNILNKLLPIDQLDFILEVVNFRFIHYIFEPNITCIEKNFFLSYCSLTEIVIPDTVNDIKEHGFSRLKYLTKVVIPDTVSTIEDNAFYNCPLLKEINVSKSSIQECKNTLPSSLKIISSSTFANCYVLTSIVIPNSVKFIQVCAFRYCISLSSVVIPNSVTSIGDYAFHGCKNLEHINIPDSVKKIGYFTFRETKIIKIEISEKTTVDKYCFNPTTLIIRRPFKCKYIFDTKTNKIVKNNSN